MSRLEQLRARRNELIELARRRGAYNVRVFGSVARGEDDADSDVDVLVSLEPGTSLLEFAGLYLDLKDLLGTEVDLVSDGGISPYLREQILREAVPL